MTGRSCSHTREKNRIPGSCDFEEIVASSCTRKQGNLSSLHKTAGVPSSDTLIDYPYGTETSMAGSMTNLLEPLNMREIHPSFPTNTAVFPILPSSTSTTLFSIVPRIPLHPIFALANGTAPGQVRIAILACRPCLRCQES